MLHFAAWFTLHIQNAVLVLFCSEFFFFFFGLLHQFPEIKKVPILILHSQDTQEVCEYSCVHTEPFKNTLHHLLLWLPVYLIHPFS